MLLHRFAARWRHAWLLLAVVAFDWLLPTAARAQAQQPAGPPVHDGTIPYLLVVLCVALAFILLCRSSSRSKEIRLEELDED